MLVVRGHPKDPDANVSLGVLEKSGQRFMWPRSLGSVAVCQIVIGAPSPVLLQRNLDRGLAPTERKYPVPIVAGPSRVYARVILIAVSQYHSYRLKRPPRPNRWNNISPTVNQGSIK